MMNRALLLALLFFAAALLGLAGLSQPLMALTFPLLLYLAAALFFSPADIDLQARRHVEMDRTQPGGPITIEIRVTNHGSPLGQVLLEEHLPDGLTIQKGNHHLVTELGASQTFTLSYTARAGRGIYRFQDLKVTILDPLWLTQRKMTIPAPAQILVQPSIEKVDRIPIRPRNTRVYAGYIPSRQAGSGVEFFGVRQYQPGDPLRWINWKASARFQHSLFINQYEQQRITDVGIILDTRKRSEIRTESGDSLFEHSIDATAALADRFLDDGNRVSLLLYGTQLDWTIPGYSKIQKERIQNSLARAELGDSLVFDKLENIPTRLMPPKSQIVLISPLQADDLPVLVNLRAHGYAVLVISPDPIAFEKNRLREQDAKAATAVRFARLEREALLEQLQQAGISVVSWDVEDRLQSALHRAYRRPQAALAPGRISR